MNNKIKLIIISLLLIVFFPGRGSTAESSDNFYTTSDPWVYTITHKVEISNYSNSNIEDIIIPLPLMDHNQPRYQDFLGEEFDPWPSKIIISKSGTRQGIFNIPLLRPGEKIILKQKYAVKNYAIDYQIDPNQVSADYKGYLDINERYLNPETKIESNNPLIINYAKDVVKDETNPYIIAQKLFADINLFMTYNKDNANKGALHALRTGEGVCEDYTDLYVASARALGIPARWLSGYLYLPREYNSQPYIRADGSLDIESMRHAWPEIYLPEIGWMVLDPTFTYIIKSGKGQEKAVDWNKFGKIESGTRHIFFNYGSHDNGRIEYKYSGPKPEAIFSEYLEFGKKISPFRDIVNHWAKDSIMFLADYSPPIIGGYGNGLFGPNDCVTRAQLVMMLKRVFSWEHQSGKSSFTDVKPEYWAYGAIVAAKEAGIIGGFPDGSFKPDKKVSRAEIAAILDRAFELPYPSAGATFKDLGKPGYAWADSSIITLAGNGIAGGYNGGYFRPERYVTRAEAATFLSRILYGTFRVKV